MLPTCILRTTRTASRRVSSLPASRGALGCAAPASSGVAQRTRIPWMVSASVARVTGEDLWRPPCSSRRQPVLRALHTTPQTHSTTFLIAGVGTGAVLMGIKYASQAYTQWKKNRPKTSSKGGAAWQKRFYEGGFEEEMTRREAALILGVRETAGRERIREAHRKLMLLNHPDKGGSIFVTAKINEAKDKLLGSDGPI